MKIAEFGGFRIRDREICVAATDYARTQQSIRAGGVQRMIAVSIANLQLGFVRDVR